MAISKKKSHLFEVSSDDFNEAVHDLADAVIENMIDPDALEEPFEAYVQRTKIRLCSESNHFKNRFIKGYQVLMIELSKHEYRGL